MPEDIVAFITHDLGGCAVGIELGAHVGLTTGLFREFSGIDWTDVDEISFTFTESQGGEFSIAIDDLQVVPEPSTAALVGMGLVGLVLAGRRQHACV